MPGVNDVDERLAELGLELPPPPQAIAAYVPVVVHGNLAFIAGQVPMVDGTLLHAGALGDTVSIEDGQEAARQAVLQSLSALRDALGSFDRLQRILKLDVFVASAPSFTEQPKVANGASELLVDVLGEAGRHARAAVGVPSLPLGSSVEVVVTAAVSG
jgi:enamine deaminase RidA (YjgF/YER057c/UK114 family)